MKYPKTRIINDSGCLRIRWGYNKTIRGFSLGLRDSMSGMAEAKVIKAQIERDFEKGLFDPLSRDYSRYQQPKAEAPATITAPELFRAFTNHRAKAEGLAQSSVDARYVPIAKALEKSLNLAAADIDLSHAELFADGMAASLTPETAKARISLLASAWDWAINRYKLPLNPWAGMGSRFKKRPRQKPQRFTKDEVKTIIDGFRSSKDYSHYSDFVELLFGLGLRPGEAMGLEWRAVSKDFGSVWIGRSITNGITSDTTKTKKDRTLNIPPSMGELLRRRKAKIQPPDDNALIFTTPNGLPIHTRNFRNRAWKKVLDSLGIDYRRPYTTRATAESFALASEQNHLAVAEAFGHTPKVMFDYYADVINKEPVFFEF